MNSTVAMNDQQIMDRLAAVPGWSLVAGKLFRRFEFADFVAAFGFMTRVALIVV